VIALVVLTFFSLVIAALMSLGGSSLIATSALRTQRAEIYAAEAAVDEDVTGVRAGASPCDPTVVFAAPTYSSPMTNPVSVSVRCEAQPGAAGGGLTILLSAFLAGRPAPVLRVKVRLSNPPPLPGTAKVLEWDENRETPRPA
jgi:hypothetical protein